MLKNYFTIAIRHLTRHKFFSLINIFCLAIGITFSMIIGVYILKQENINSNIKDVNNQYLLKSKWKQENMGYDITTLGPLAKTMKDEYPGLVAGCYRFDPVTDIVSVGNKHFREDISIGDTTFVSMYGFPLLYGNPNQVFINNKSAVVTQDFAIKYFGNTDVVNKVITIQTPADGIKHDFMISAVLKKMPYNSISNFAVAKTEYQVYLPMENNQYFQGGDKGDNWSNIFMVGFIELQKGVLPKDLEKPFAQVLLKYQPDFVKGNLKVELAQLTGYYLKNNNNAVQKMITALSLIAVFILLLAVINFININIGTSSYRLKEIGLRKVFGSPKMQLIIQFIIESWILTCIAAIISIFLYELLRPVFNQLLNATLDPVLQFNFAKIIFLLFLIITVGFISGIYPAFVLSSSNVVNAVKGKVNSAEKGLMLRKTLLVVQFTLAIIVFISSLNVSQQVAYFFNKDLGYNKEDVMIISSLPRQWDSAGIVKMENVKTQLLQMPEVKSVSLSADIPDGSGGYVNVYTQNNSNFISMLISAADEDFAKVYGIKIKEGVFLNNNNNNYIPGRVVLNETAVKYLGWNTNAAVGKTIRLGAADGTLLTVVGVVKDFHYESLQRAIQPLVIANLNEPFTRSYRYFSIKLNTSAINNSINKLQDKWKELFPESGFEYAFMSEKFQSLYRSELQLKKAANIATALNLVIVFLGIFGVVAFTLAKRTKEIAVRKVLGADVRNIIFLFIKEYALLILIANIIAWPLAYYITNSWLQNYANRIHQNFVPYLLVFAFVFIMALALIIAQCFKIAVANPIKSLRTE
jgi:putative ABC transport system permease protein